MIGFAGCRFEIGEVSVDLTEMTCATRYVIYRIDIYRSEYGDHKKEIKIPIGIERDRLTAEKLMESIKMQ